MIPPKILAHLAKKIVDKSKIFRLSRLSLKESEAEGDAGCLLTEVFVIPQLRVVPGLLVS
jgi:hypothetical protein